MSVKKFKFVSPGVFLNEIDKSQIPKAAVGVGPLVIGRSTRGPGNRPVQVSSYSEFIQIFGSPNPGVPGKDIWRSTDGSAAPTYAAYAAQAWLANNSPLTFMRLVGKAHASVATDSARAGWWTWDGATKGSMKTVSASDTGGGAYGLWLVPSASTDDPLNGIVTAFPTTGTLAAVWYVAEGSVTLSGSTRGSPGIGGTAATGTLALDTRDDLATGDGAILSDGENTLNKGIFIRSLDRTVLDGQQIILDFSDNTEFLDGAGAALQNHTITIIDNADATSTSAGVLGSVGAHECRISCRGSDSGDLTSAATLANRIVQALKRDTGYSTGGGEAGTTEEFTFGASWQLGGTAGTNDDTAGGDSGGLTTTPLVASVVNTDGVKIQARGSQGSGVADYANNYGWYGGPTGDTWSVTPTIQLAGGGIMTDADVTSGTSTGASRVRLKTEGGDISEFTANGTGSYGFLVNPHLTEATADTLTAENLKDAIHAHANWSAVRAGDIVTVTNNADVGNAGNSATLSVVPTPTHAAWTVQGYGDTLDEKVFILGVETTLGESFVTSSNSNMIKSAGPNARFVLDIRDNAGEVTKSVTFDFADGSSKHIRKVFDTNPTLINSLITTNSKNYWLGETYEKAVETHVLASAGSQEGDIFGVVLGLAKSSGGGADEQWANMRMDAQPAKSPWIFSQHMGPTGSMKPADCQQLFRFVSHQAGQWDMHNLKVAIEDIMPSTNDNNPFGTFTVVIRRLRDHDQEQQVVERYSGLSLNPASRNYLAARLGDQFTRFDTTQRRLRTYGAYRNKSQYLRVEMNQELDESGMDPALLPFGFEAPPRPYNFSILGEAATPYVEGSTTTAAAVETKQFAQGESIAYAGKSGAFISGTIGFTGSFKWPTITCRASSADGGFSDPKKAYFGFYSGKTTSNTDFEPSTLDLLRPLPQYLKDETHTAGSNTVSPFYFTLDDISGSFTSDSPNPDDANHVLWISGSRAGTSTINGSSITAKTAGLANDGTAGESNLYPGGWRFLLQKLGINRFIVPMHGGFDGLDITEREPFTNKILLAAAGDSKTSYEYNTIEEAIDIISSVEDYEFNIVTMPGITNAGLTEKLVDVCTERGDALAIIDLPDVFVPTPEIKKTNTYDRYGNVREVVANLQDRSINSSYGCTYYPWALITDASSDVNLKVPPSVVALGTMASSEASTEPWFAPAGFNRGGLSAGSSGLTVIGVTEKLSAKNRDKLYEANINPIASFPAEGIVVFGQKTLQITPSALDRINVRRLLIFIKKNISRMAAGVLFDQNVQVTWNRFVGQVDPFLKGVKTRLGLADYKIILDETTTTPDLIDRNILYAKIFLKPARAIEYIAIDFMVTRTGASFED